MDKLRDLTPGQLHLLIAARSAGYRLMNALAAHLALAGPLQVLDGGNGFDLYAIARAARQQAARPDAVLQRINIARAFTCYQMVSLLAEHGASERPTLVMNLLGTFYDENVQLAERLRLLRSGLTLLRHLSRQTPVLVSASPTGADQAPEPLELLTASADRCWCADAPQHLAQPRLF